MKLGSLPGIVRHFLGVAGRGRESDEVRNEGLFTVAPSHGNDGLAPLMEYCSILDISDFPYY